jgi:hypothetical protein
VAGKPETVNAVTFQVMSDANASTDVIAVGPVLEALRSGDATYVAIARATRADYVPPRPPL